MALLFLLAFLLLLALWWFWPRIRRKVSLPAVCHLCTKTDSRAVVIRAKENHWFFSRIFSLASEFLCDWRISYILQPFHGFLRAEKQREGQIIAFQIKVSKAARAIAGDKRIRQSLSPGISLRRPISANPELNFNPGIFFWPFDLLCVDSFSPSNI